MPLSSTDLVWYYTDAASGPANNTLSLGGSISPSTITSGLDENVFDDVTGAESESGESHYRAIALRDTHATHDYLNYEAWIEGYTRSGVTADTIYFSLEIPHSTPGSIAIAADEFTSPSTTDFVQGWEVEGIPSNTITPSGNTLDASDTSKNWVGIWLWRTIPAGASAYSGRACTIKFRGETTGSPRMVIEKTWSINWSKDGQISVQSI